MSDLSTNDLKLAIEAGFVRVVTLLQQVASEASTRDGKLNLLTTTAKDSLVDAVNELNAAVRAAARIDDNQIGLTTTLSSHEIVAKINEAVTNLIAGAGDDSDTLRELAERITAQAGATAGFLSTTAPQMLEADAQRQGRDNLGLGALATKETEINDLEQTTTNTWSASKVADYVADAVAQVNGDTLQTTADFAAVVSAKWSELNAGA